MPLQLQGVDAAAAEQLDDTEGESSDDEHSPAAAAQVPAGILDAIVGVRADFGHSSGSTPHTRATAGGARATAPAFGRSVASAPAFAAGRACSIGAFDALLAEAHVSPFTVPLLRLIVQAASRGDIGLVPAVDALVMARIATGTASPRAKAHRPATGSPPAPPAEGSSSLSALRRQAERQLMACAAATPAAPALYDISSPGAPQAPATRNPLTVDGQGGTSPSQDNVQGGEAQQKGHGQRGQPLSYGQVADALIHGWRLLPLGLYRRVHAATGLRTPPATVAAAVASVGAPARTGAAFEHNDSLVSYVFANPLPETMLSAHDFVYVVAAAGED